MMSYSTIGQASADPAFVGSAIRREASSPDVGAQTNDIGRLIARLVAVDAKLTLVDACLAAFTKRMIGAAEEIPTANDGLVPDAALPVLSVLALQLEERAECIARRVETLSAIA